MSFYYNFTLDYFTANETSFELVGASCNEVDIIDIENTNDRLLNTIFSCYGSQYRRQVEELDSRNKSKGIKISLLKVVIIIAIMLNYVLCFDVSAAINLDIGPMAVNPNNQTDIDLKILSLGNGTTYSHSNGTVYGLVTEVNDTRNIGPQCVPVGGVCVPQCQTSEVTEKRIYQRGNWWEPYSKVSGCLKNGLGDGGAMSLDYSFTKTETHEAGFDINFGIDWFNAHMGYSVSKSYSKSQQYRCDVDKDSWAVSVWYQQHYVWVDTQERVRTIFTPDCHMGSDSYTNWGTTRHADIPITAADGDMIEGNFGCSTNNDAECE